MKKYNPVIPEPPKFHFNDGIRLRIENIVL